MNYVPLQVISGYTFLSSALKVEQIVEICMKNRIRYAAVADKDNLFACPELHALCRKNGISPIYGTHFSFPIDGEDIIVYLYIRDEDGYASLCRLLSEEKNFENLKKRANGLTMVLPTISNPYLNRLIERDPNRLREIAAAFKEIYDSFYLGIEYYSRSDKELVRLYRRFSEENHLEKVIFPKHLYEHKKDAMTAKILEAIRDDERLTLKKEEEGPYYYLSERAVDTLYTEDEKANSFRIAEAISFSLAKKRGSLLEYPLSSEMSTKKYLFFLCIQNAKKMQVEWNETYAERLEYEIDIIDRMGFCSYFLIVQDYVNYARNRSIPIGPGRGSAAGSLVSYLLGITEVDPIRYHLMFERFLNPSRVTMPDIDIDIADYARGEVIDYINTRYGPNRMANIVTFQTIGAKQSLRDIGKVFSANNADINTLCALIKGNQSIDEAILKSEEFRALYSDPYFFSLISLAKKIEGFPRQESIHAGGVILNHSDLRDVLPTKIGADGKLISEFEAAYLEDLGFLKMDVLGLRNLSIISYCETMIRRSFPSFSIKKIPFDDPKTFDVLNAGLTQAIFQLEGEGITRALKSIRMQSFDDIVALLALYRPGPMSNIPLYASRKNNREEVRYPHPLVERILKPTYGVIVYQEQIMEIAQKISSFSLADADLFRRAIAKKDSEKMNALKDRFIDGALKNGIGKPIAEEIFEWIDKFANYGFNKSHSVSYAILAYQMAYLKANYPNHFYATMLTFQGNSSDRYSKFLNEFNLFQIRLSTPNINRSEMEYSIRDDKILLPFSSIRRLPQHLAEAIVQERVKGGYFTDFEQVVQRLLPYSFSADHLMSLINAGALDCFTYNRATMRKALVLLIEFYNTAAGSRNLFSQDIYEQLKPEIAFVEDDERLNLELELETIGILISGSLFDRYSEYVMSHRIQKIFTVSSSSASVNIGIIITKTKEITTRNNTRMAIVYGFDDSQEIEAVFFSRQLEQYRPLLKEGNAVLLRGIFRNNENFGLSFLVDYAEKMEENKQ